MLVYVQQHATIGNHCIHCAQVTSGCFNSPKHQAIIHLTAVNPSSSPSLRWYYLLFFRFEWDQSESTEHEKLLYFWPPDVPQVRLRVASSAHSCIYCCLSNCYIYFILSILFLFHFPFGVTTFVSHHRCLVPPVYPPALHGSCFLDPTCQLFLPSFFLYFSFPFRSFLST